MAYLTMATPTTSTAAKHLFTQVSHSELRKLGRNNLQTFLRERERYLLKVADANNSVASITFKKLKESFKTDLPLSLIALGEFTGVSNIADVPEDEINARLSEKEKVKLQILNLEDFEYSILRNFRVKFIEPDATLRILGAIQRLSYPTLHQELE
eukprot:IDg11307t1